MPRKKKLNISLIKAVVMSALSLAMAFGFALAGIGAQVAAAPTVQFLLGFTPDRTKGTSIAFALFAAVGGVIGYIAAGSSIDFGIAVMLGIGATLGTILTIKLAAEPRYAVLRRAGQSIGIVVAIYVFGEAMRHRIGGPQPFLPSLTQISPLLTGLLFGVATGAISNLLQIATGILVVPALIYLLGMDASRAVVTSLAVIAFAGFFPALNYSSRGAVDKTMGSWMSGAGLLGGLGAGTILSRLSVTSSLPLIAFALISMFLCAWRIWKMT